MPERLVDLIRHGAVEGGIRFRGCRDDPLSDEGWRQMERALQDGTDWSAVLSSPLRRCYLFATRLCMRRDLPLTVHFDWREREFGDWEGQAPEQLPVEELTRFWTDPTRFVPPNGESYDDFRRRILELWKVCLTGTERHTLIVTHGGVIRLLIAEVLRMPPDALLRIEVPFGSLTRIRLPDPPGVPTLVFHREI